MAEDRLKALVRELSVLGPVAGVCRHLPVVIVDSGRGIPPTLFREVKLLRRKPHGSGDAVSISNDRRPTGRSR
jgi:hypothetical protein